MNRHKRIAKVVYKGVQYEEYDDYEGMRLRNYMVLILPKSFNPNRQGVQEIRVDGGVNLAGKYTTSVGYSSDKCTIEKPSIRDYLELSMALKYKDAYKSKNERRRG